MVTMDGMQPKIACFINQSYLCPRFFYSLILTESDKRAGNPLKNSGVQKNLQDMARPYSPVIALTKLLKRGMLYYFGDTLT